MEFDFEERPSPKSTPRGSPRQSPRYSPERDFDTPRATRRADEEFMTPTAAYASADLGWSPARMNQLAEEDPYQSEYESTIPSPRRSSPDLPLHRPVAQHLTQVEQPVLLPDAMSANIHEYEEFELQGSESPYASPEARVIEHGGAGPEDSRNSLALGPMGSLALEPSEDGFHYVSEVPHNIYQSDHKDPNSVYYPAPVPAKLKLPPLLAAANKNRASLPGKKARPRSMMMMNVPLEPEWEPSPIDHEVVGRENEELSDVDSMMVESDHSSYAASDLSDTSYQRNLDDEAYGSGGLGARSGASRTHRKPNQPPQQKRGWLSTIAHSMIGKQGDLDYKDTEVSDQEDLADRFDASAFTRYDPDHIREEAKRFEVGGVYSSTRPVNGKPTSLIEELEIRKAGRKLQRQNMLLDADYVKTNLALQNKHAHPLDREHQPTLMELQQIAETDYADRKEWHQAATVRQKQERGEESLAERRARRRAARGVPAPMPVDNPVETLAERRARRRQEREYRNTLIVPTAQGTAQGEESPTIVSLEETESPLIAASH